MTQHASQSEYFAKNRDWLIPAALGGSVASMAEVVKAHEAEMHEFDPSEFEGTPESGPMAPKSSIEQEISCVFLERTERRLTRAIKLAGAAAYQGEVLIALAEAVGYSPNAAVRVLATIDKLNADQRAELLRRVMVARDAEQYVA